MRFPALLLLSSVQSVVASEQVAFEQLSKRIRHDRMDVTLANGTTRRGHLQGTQLAHGGSLTVGTWNSRVVACREVHTIAYEPTSGRAFARGLVGAAIGLGMVLGGVSLTMNTSLRTSPVLLAPAGGIYGACRLIPRHPRTLSLVCP